VYAPLTLCFLVFLHSSPLLLSLHSFPTRRSSDLVRLTYRWSRPRWQKGPRTFHFARPVTGIVSQSAFSLPELWQAERRLAHNACDWSGKVKRPRAFLPAWSGPSICKPNEIGRASCRERV